MVEVRGEGEERENEKREGERGRGWVHVQYMCKVI